MSSLILKTSADSHIDDDAAANDIDGHIYPATGGFYTKFFEAKSWSSAAATMVQAWRDGIGAADWSPEGFAAWLSQFQSQLPGGVAARYT